MKAIVNMNTLHVTSAYNMETLKKVAKFRPDALVLYKGEGKDKEPVCAICVGHSGSMSPNGVVFAQDNMIGERVALVSEQMPHVASADEAREYIRDRLGMLIVNGNKIEAQIEAALTEIAADEAAMNDAIVVEG